MKLKCLFFVLVLSGTALAKNNGLAQTPPMGWRSWNAFLLDVNQDKMLAQAKAMSSPYKGQPPLSSYGFVEIGIDDGWQSCTSNGFHDPNGNPVVNTTRFPDLKAFSDSVHAMGLKSGWYQNNCWCGERGKQPAHVKQDVNATVAFLFDGLKVDGCGPAHNITEWAEALAASGRDVVLENCGDNHDNWSPPDLAELEDCDFNFYRISDDIAPQFYSAMYNLQHQVKYQDETRPLSRPGCFAYSDMSIVGLIPPVESRTHFSAWAVTSSPLVLGLDMTNQTAMDIAYPIVSNQEVIAVNQQVKKMGNKK